MFLGKVALWVWGDFSVFCRFEKEEGCLGETPREPVDSAKFLLVE